MRSAGVPGLSPCPSWCLGPAEHRQAVEEGCEQDSLRHLSGDRGFRVDRLTNPHVPNQVLRAGGGSVAVQLLQESTPLPFGGFPVIEVRMSGGRGDLVAAELTGGEARSLAALLVRMADKMEFGELGGAR